jgi:hypothetical protein
MSSRDGRRTARALSNIGLDVSEPHAKLAQASDGFMSRSDM